MEKTLQIFFSCMWSRNIKGAKTVGSPAVVAGIYKRVSKTDPVHALLNWHKETPTL